mgnify:CR=1 FL=1
MAVHIKLYYTEADISNWVIDNFFAIPLNINKGRSLMLMQ